MGFACDGGLSTLAINWVGVGLSSQPANRELEPKQHAAFITTFVCTSNSHTLMLLHSVNAL
jgi:hypothetical protein